MGHIVHLISQLIGVLNGHEDSVRYISKLEDGNIISASCHKTIEIWNVDLKVYWYMTFEKMPKLFISYKHDKETTTLVYNKLDERVYIYKNKLFEETPF